MGDKFSNVLIVFIMILIIVLGGMYYVKIVQNQDYTLDNPIGYREETEQNNEAITANANTVSGGLEENRPVIGDVENNYSSNENSKAIGYKYNNRYYYNRLTDYSKVIYNAIVNNIDNIKTGKYKIDIDYDFGSLLNTVDGQEELKLYYEDAVNAINLDVPHLFYLEFSKMSLNIERTSNIFSTTYKLYIDSGKFENYLKEEFTSGAAVDVAASQVEGAKNQVMVTLTGTDYYKAKKLHDWLIDYMYYDATSKQKATVYGGLIEKKGVCEAYSRIYKYILDEIGIENILVTGTATNSTGVTEEHMWNYLKIDNKWYAVDVTWDDPIIVGGGKINDKIKHKYFLVGSQEFFKNHSEKLTISTSGRIFAPPKLNQENY